MVTRLTTSFYLTTSSSGASSSPSDTRKRSGECSDSIRSKGFGKVYLENVRRVHKPGGALRVTGTHHIIFSIGSALRKLGYRIMNQTAWARPDPVRNALPTAFTY